jgi:hypothetical protein
MKKVIKSDYAYVVCYDSSGVVVLRKTISLEMYYEGVHPFIDSSEYRQRRGICKIIGELYRKAKLVQSFDLRYDMENGKQIGRKVVFDDGTIQKEGIFDV